MNKLLILIFSVVCLTGLYHVSSISASPAVMAGPLWCNAYDVTGTSRINLEAAADELDTDSNNNNVQYFCKGITDSPGEAIVWNAYNVPDAPQPCTNDDGTLSTFDWHETISARGKVTLICHFKD